MKFTIGLLAALLILTGCSTNQKLDTATAGPTLLWTDHFNAISAIKHWQSNA